jgi:two-component system chemotaxis response regulator CheY
MSYNILIVDDSRTIRSVIKKTLDIAGVPVGDLYEAENGKEALDVMNSNWIDLIFADINMPVMSGIEMVKKMSEDNMLDKTPVIIVSTEGSKTRIDDLLELGVRAYLRKPINPEDLRNIVKEVMGDYNEG